MKRIAGEVMKLRMIAVGLLLLLASTAVPFLACGEMAGTDASSQELKLPPEDEPTEPVSVEHPAAVSEPTSGKEQDVAPTAPLAEPVPRKEAEATPSGASQALQPEDNSWWKNFMYKLGFGADPNPGEIVQSAPSGTGVDADYIIGPGDQIGISVWRDDNLTRIVVVLPDGKIQFPLVGEIVAGGKSVSQLKKELEAKLSRFISDTGVTVEVKQSNSMIIYVIGRVNAPGRQILLANTNVMQALAMVGGLNPFAEKGKIKIFRQDAGKTVMFSFNYNDVSEGRHLETNIDLKRGDVIIVP
jgi:polysaccharide export outer membrane protein